FPSSSPRLSPRLRVGVYPSRASKFACWPDAQPLVVGEVAVERVALVQVFFIGHPRYDLVLHTEEVLVPVGLHFKNVEAGMVVESQVERAGDAFEDAQLAQARFVISTLLAGQLAVLQLS